MRKAEKGIRLVVLSFAAVSSVLGVSCSSDECEDNKNSLPLAEFYSSLPEPQKVDIDSVSVYGIGAPGDSVLLDSVQSVGGCYLPFRIDEGKTDYVVSYLKRELHGMADTLSFIYEIRPEFVSSACGAVYYYDKLQVRHTTNMIDSVVCPGGRITNANRANIFIYFRVEDEQPKSVKR